MGMIRKRGARYAALESLLRRARPEASPELIGRVAAIVEARSARQHRRWSKAAFAGAVTVFMLGTFASFGGLSYAASSARDTAEAVKSLLTASAPTVRSNSAAADQYEEEEAVEEVTAVQPTPPAPGAIAPAEAAELPFTGLSLLTTVLIGGTLLLLGILLRRREIRKTS